ncbi:DUF3341 domain-containing protein [uncultured Draconibacterium sp.]|uniref:DUF3341 domain-containing protein n=1 Tax=uncultured Draconibacterium sp. TaxID=1573823 RepID=UPI0025DF538B|nr:DUF3341 domain-containing protein [uncultured Draconibacterium sp.]
MSKKYMLGVFNDEATLVDAFEKLKNKGLTPVEVYTPYPVHEILEGMPIKTRITHAAFFFGLFAAIGILGFLTYAAVYSWPLHYGGKPFNAFPSFIVVTIVATILSITLLTLFTFSARANIFPGKKAKIFHERATDDKFVMVFDEADIVKNSELVKTILTEHGKIENKISD